MSNRIDIEIRDKIDDSIAKKLAYIAAAAKAANNQITALKQNLTGATANVNRLGNSFLRTAVAAQVAKNQVAQKLTVMQRLRTAYSSAASGASQLASRFIGLRTTSMLLNSDMLSLIRTLRTISGIVVIAGVGKNILDAADAFQVMQNQLRGVTTSSDQLVKTQDELFKIANNARAPVGDMTKAYRRFDMALAAVGASQRESLNVTETVGKLLAINGASAQEAGAVLLQLSQAFNKGKLDGDEFRSVAELMPQILDAVAKAAGKSRKDIYEMSRDGQINIAMLQKAFKDIKPSVDAAFKNLPMTIGQAITILQNNLVKFFGELDKKWGFSESIIKIVDYISNNLPQVFRLIESLLVGIATVSIPTIFVALNVFTGGLFTVASLLGGIAAWFTYIGDQIVISGTGFVTLRDLAYGFYKIIEQLVSGAGEIFQEIFNAKNASYLVNDILIPSFKFLVYLIMDLAAQWAAFWQVIVNTDWKTLGLAFLQIFTWLGDQVYNIFVIAFLKIAEVAERIFYGVINRINSNLPSIFQGPEIKFTEKDAKRYQALAEDLTIGFSRLNYPELYSVYSQIKDQFEINLDEMSSAYSRFSNWFIQQSRQNAIERINADGTVFQKFQMNLQIYASQLKAFSKRIMTYTKDGDASVIENWAAALQNWQTLWTNTVTFIKGLLDQLWSAIQAIASALSSLAGSAGPAVGSLIGTMMGGSLGGLAGRGLGLVGDPNAGLRTQNELLAKMQAMYDNATKSAQNFGDKATNSMNGLNNATNDASNTFMQLAQQAFGHVTDAIIEFTNTGKFEFKKMLKAIVDDLLRFFLNRFFQKMLFSIFGGGFGGMGGMMGGMMGGFGGGMGFAAGGYTGNLPTGQVAGFVHGQEFVMPAGATKRNRPVLEAMKRGANVTTTSVGRSNVQMNVSVKNYTDGNIQVRRINQTDVEIIATQVAERTVQERTPRLVANEIRNANSRISKSLTDSTQTRRRR